MTVWESAVRRWFIAGEQYREATAIALEGFDCAYCGEPAQTIDHIRPRIAGGSDDATNLVPACRSCNGSKGARSLESWVEWMRTVARRLSGAERVMGIEPEGELSSAEFEARWREAEQMRRVFEEAS